MPNLGGHGLARKKHAQPFTHKPATKEDAQVEVRLAQEQYDQAIGEYQRYLYSSKPGKQRRFNQVQWAASALKEAEDNLHEIQKPKPTLFP